MKKIWRIIFILVVSLILSACSFPSMFASDDIDLSITPQRAATQSQPLQNAKMLWGGVIISSINLKDATQFEILAYPLSDAQKPDTNKMPIGRFLALQDDYLELTDYAQGRLITVSGLLQGKRRMAVGQSEYVYPVLHITQLHLWSKAHKGNQAQFHLGIGLRF